MKVEVYKAISEAAWIYYCPRCGAVRKHDSQRRAFMLAEIHARLENMKSHPSSGISRSRDLKSLTSKIRTELYASPS